jgi:hypothetical protein
VSKINTALGALTLGVALALAPLQASADPVKECVTVEEGKNKNWTVTTTEEQRAACPSDDSASNPVDEVVAEDTANHGGQLPPGQQG